MLSGGQAVNKKRLAWTSALIAILIFIFGYPLTYRIGIDGELFEKKIPLYAKACGFLYRDWAYREIVHNIIGWERNDTKKALLILRWVNDNIMYGIPQGLKVMDDHPLNIIIRQYGAKDQIEDIFTILCSYAGIKAGMYKCYNKEKSRHMILSFVNASGRWLIFDAARNKYFRNKKSGVGSVEDYYNGDLILSDNEKATYEEFLDGLKYIDFSSSTRPEEQNPFTRLPAELKKMFIKKQ